MVKTKPRRRVFTDEMDAVIRELYPVKGGRITTETVNARCGGSYTISQVQSRARVLNLSAPPPRLQVDRQKPKPKKPTQSQTCWEEAQRIARKLAEARVAMALAMVAMPPTMRLEHERRLIDGQRV